VRAFFVSLCLCVFVFPHMAQYSFTTEMSAETAAEIPRASGVGCRRGRGAAPADRCAHAIETSVFTGDDRRAIAQSGFITKKHRRLRSDGNVEMGTIEHDKGRREANAIAKLRRPRTEIHRTGFGDQIVDVQTFSQSDSRAGARRMAKVRTCRGVPRRAKNETNRSDKEYPRPPMRHSSVPRRMTKATVK